MSPYPGMDVQKEKEVDQMDRCVQEVLQSNFTPEGADPNDPEAKKSAAIAICREQLGK